MDRAGRGALTLIHRRFPGVKSLTVYAGSGNNAGDGYIVAGYAKSRGYDVELLQVGRAESLGEDAARAFEFAQSQGVDVEPMTDAPPRGDVLVDALLGTGAHGDMREPFQRAIDHLNGADRLVVAIDLPSGVNTDTGGLFTGSPVRADLTVTFIAPKLGLVTGPATDFVGELVVDRLEAPTELFSTHEDPGVLAIDGRDRTSFIRPMNAHKGLFGRLVVVGGDHDMGGAVALTARAALSIGAGIVRVATRGEHRTTVLGQTPEAMVLAVEYDEAVETALTASTTLALGPGLGRSDWGETLARRVLAHCVTEDKPIVVDADALNFIAAHGPAIPARTVLTPHPGEAARLLGTDNASIQADRPAAVLALAARFAPAVVVLKGAGTLVARGPEIIGVCRVGNPGLATPGSGDVLTGVVGGLLASGLDPSRAACLGVWMHASAGDRACKSQPTILASDIVRHLVTAVR